MTDSVQHTYGDSANGHRDGRTTRRIRILVVAIIIILLLALLGVGFMLVNLISPRSGVAPADATGGIEWVRSIYGWGTTPETQFVQPHKLDIAEDGTIWVTDALYPNQVFAFSPEGQYVSSVGGEAEVPLRGLGPVAVGMDDRIFVGEPMLDWVRVFTKEGQDLGAFSVPNPIDIEYSDGTMVIGSTSGFAIIDPETGTPRTVIGTRGQGDNEFDTVNGVAIDADGAIYVSDAYNNRLSKYDAEGGRVWMVATGAPGNQVEVTGGTAMAESRVTTAPAQMQLPGGVTIDGSGRVVVADAFDFSISVFDPDDGTFLAKYGEYGRMDGQFVWPVSIEYDPQRDWFAVADKGNSRVQIIRLPGSAPGAGVESQIRRSLAGPLRACVPPILLILLVLLVLSVRALRRRAESRKAGSGEPV